MSAGVSDEIFQKNIIEAMNGELARMQVLYVNRGIDALREMSRLGQSLWYVKDDKNVSIVSMDNKESLANLNAVFITELTHDMISRVEDEERTVGFMFDCSAEESLGSTYTEAARVARENLFKHKWDVNNLDIDISYVKNESVN